MRISISCKGLLASAAATFLLAGCVSTPAPVVNHSFGPGQPASSAAPAVQPAPAQPQASGAQTFGLGGHANGTVTSAGYTVAPGDTLYSIAFANGLDFRALAARNGIPPPYTLHPGQVLKLTSTDSASTGPQNAGAGTVASTVPSTQPTAPVFGPVMTAPSTSAPAPATASTVAPASSVAETAKPSVPVQAPVQPKVAPIPMGATRKVAGVTWRWPADGKVISDFKAGSGGDGAGVDIAGKAGDPVRAAAAGTVVYSGNGLPGYGALIIIKHNDTYLSAYGHNRKRLVKEGQQVKAGQEIALMGASGAPRVELHFEIRKNGKPVDPTGYLPKR